MDDFDPLPLSSPSPAPVSHPLATPHVDDSTVKPTGEHLSKSTHFPHRYSDTSLSSYKSRAGTLSSLGRDSSSPKLDKTTLSILAGEVGGSFGPYPLSSTFAPQDSGRPALFSRRDSLVSSDVAIDLLGTGTDSTFTPPGRLARDSSTPLESSPPLASGAFSPVPGYSSSYPRHTPDETDRLLWVAGNEEDDDFLHNIDDPAIEKMLDHHWSAMSPRGWLNVGTLVSVILGILSLFAVWPVASVLAGGWKLGDDGSSLGGAEVSSNAGGWGPGGINASGQVPSIPNMPLLIDRDTPEEARSRVGFDGENYNLVFSDEFNTEGRTFWPGDDPFWEAVDLHYWGTVDLQWYDPDAVITKNGKLELTLSQQPTHGLNFRSGMISSWNKLCFQGGYIEVSMSMPGTVDAMGFWPGAWTMGNLARPGYGASTHGMWPYTYNSCDVGTLPNQTFPNGTTPRAARTSGPRDYGGSLSYLPGQRASACTCAGEDHPGPNVGVGRGAPEIDLAEVQIDWRGTGSVSQSTQVAPMDAGYLWHNVTPYIEIFDDNRTFQNIWQGSIYQESLSVITLTDTTSYDDHGYVSVGYEYDPGDNGRITWAVNGTPSWQMNAAALEPNEEAMISQRVVSTEPMALTLNLAISNSFQTPQWDRLVFPGVLRIDYVRLYQKGTPKISCDPPDHPTSDYIARHLNAYTNPNLTLWDASANKTWPKNRLSATGCD